MRAQSEIRDPRKLGARDRRGPTREPLVLEGEGLRARMLQHVDHLHGKLFIDRLVGGRQRVMRALRAADYNTVADRDRRATRVGGAFGEGGGFWLVPPR